MSLKPIKNNKILEDTFGRKHDYLRISLTERCNLRCTYCMPSEGVELSPKSNLMGKDEIFDIASLFVSLGVKKIRLTGGEPLVRKDFADIVRLLAKLPVELALTTNGVSLERHIPLLKEAGLRKVNISLDSLNRKKFLSITRRDYFDEVMRNIQLIKEDSFFDFKVNAVLIKGFNDNEITDFVALTKECDFEVRFIEFMPFDGNRWDRSKLVSQEEILGAINERWHGGLLQLPEMPNDTARVFRLKGAKGRVGIISSMTNPFCDSCNRIRLTANGRIKNCLFSNGEIDLLGALRAGKPLEPLIKKAVLGKSRVRGGMDDDMKLEESERHAENRSMILIGG